MDTIHEETTPEGYTIKIYPDYDASDQHSDDFTNPEPFHTFGSWNRYTLFETEGSGDDGTQHLLDTYHAEIIKQYKTLEFSTYLDDYDDPDFEGEEEGKDVDSYKDQADGREMLECRIQKFTETYGTTEEQEAIETAGVPSEFGRGKSKAMMQLKLKMESAFGSDQEAQATGKYRTRGLGKWIDPANTNIPADYRTPSNSVATTSTLTESSLRTMLQSVFEQTGDAGSYRLIAGPNVMNKVTDFTRAEGNTTSTPYQVNDYAEKRQVTFSVQRYNSDYGTFDIIPDLYLARTSGGGLTDTGRNRGYLISTDLVSINFMKRPYSIDQDDDGAGPRGYARAIVALCVKNPLGLGKLQG